jgi:hypothetical protein
MATGIDSPAEFTCDGDEAGLSAVLHPLKLKRIVVSIAGNVEPNRNEENLLVISVSPDSQWLST